MRIRTRAFLILLLLVNLLGFAQVDKRESAVELSAIGIKALRLDFKHSLNLSIKITDRETVAINTTQSGEYSNASIIQSHIKNDVLIIEDLLNPTFNLPDDKLAAHKVRDYGVTIELPANLKIAIKGNDLNLNLTGTFKDALIDIQSGHIVIQDLNSDFKIVSVYAAIDYYGDSHDVTVLKRDSKKLTYKASIKAYTALIEYVNGTVNIN